MAQLARSIRGIPSFYAVAEPSDMTRLVLAFGGWGALVPDPTGGAELATCGWPYPEGEALQLPVVATLRQRGWASR
eukprot:714185-Rhodomonas_salina.3